MLEFSAQGVKAADRIMASGPPWPATLECHIQPAAIRRSRQMPGTVPGVQRSYHAGSWVEAPYPIGAHGEKDFAGAGGNRQFRDHAAGRNKRHFTRSLLDGANAAAIMANINSARIG